jgi:hypothetical protein
MNTSNITRRHFFQDGSIGKIRQILIPDEQRKVSDKSAARFAVFE